MTTKISGESATSTRAHSETGAREVLPLSALPENTTHCTVLTQLATVLIPLLVSTRQMTVQMTSFFSSAHKDITAPKAPMTC
jgi:hypothetical protein